MQVQTIQQIKEQMEIIDSALENIDIKGREGERYGLEREYTIESLNSELKAILTDLRGLARSPKKFVLLSTHDERNNICRLLTGIVNRLANNNDNDISQYLEQLKPIVRNYGVRGSSESQSVLEERSDNLNDKCAIAENNVDKTEKIKERAEQAEARIKTAEEKLGNLDNALAELQGKINQVNNLQNASQQNAQVIEQLLASAKNQEQNINDFVSNIEEGERQLNDQKENTKSYQEALEEFKNEHKEKLDEAEKLINQARNALGYKTAEGISAAFNERYTEEKEKGKISSGWLVGATLFLVLGGVIGIWMVVSIDSEGIGLALSRITIMSLALSAAWFCAAQYVKHKNTLEDYSYKAVLSKSMVAFLDQLEGKEREHYLIVVLREIHQDPLRKKHDIDTPLSNVFSALKRNETSKKADTQTTGSTIHE